MRLGLAEKLSLFVAALVFCTSIIIGSVFYYNHSTYLVNSELDSFGHLLVKEEQRINRIIHEPIEDVLFLAEVPAIQGIIGSRYKKAITSDAPFTKEQWKRNLEYIFTALMKAKPDYLQIRFIGVADHGREIVRVEQGSDKTIKVIQGSKLQKKGSARYFRESILLSNKETYLSKIELNREHGEISKPHLPVLRIAKPVFDPEGRVFGIVVINMDISLILKKGLDKNFSAENKYYLINDSGDYITSPDSSKTFGFDLGKRYLIQEEFSVLTKALKNHDVSNRYFDKGDIIYIHKVYFDQDKPNRYIGLIYVKSYSTAINNIVNVVVQSAIWAFLLILLAVITVFFISRFQLKSLADITLAIKNFSSGHRDFHLPETREDEVGVLARAFKEMAVTSDEQDKALKESEARFRGIIHAVNDGVIIADETGIICDINPATEKLFGYTRNDLIGKNVNYLVPVPYRDKHDTYIKDIKNKAQDKFIHMDREVIALRKGSTFHAEVTVTELVLKEQRFYSAIIRDITNRRILEKKSFDYQNELQEMVDIQTQDLIIARDSALAAERAMSAFLANMSHELRTPLHGIISFSNFGIKKFGQVTDEKIKQYFSEIYESGEHLLVLVNDLLDLSKLRAGKMVYEYAEENPDVIIEEVIQEFEVLSSEKNIDITFNDESNVGSIKLDRIKFAQVIRNLISNAIKFSDSDSKIEIHSVHMNEQESYKVIVSNHGVAIPRGEEESIFEPFFQSTNTKTGAGGTGLGLPICREIIVVGHAGTITTESSGEGVTSFVVMIPISYLSIKK